MKTVNIVGGGLAGLSLGLALRQRDVPVTVFEAGDYPRHKVCGEFISGAGVSLLTDLGLETPLRSLGLRVAREVQFFVEGRSSSLVELPDAAWCISRWALDRLLAKTLEKAGGNLIRRSRKSMPTSSESWVITNGRRRGVGKSGYRVGLKFHLRSISLRADLEMHLESGAYVGLCRVENDRVNVCALLPREAVSDQTSRNPVLSLAAVFSKTLASRFEEAEYIPNSLASVAGLNYATENSGMESLCLGDAQGLIPPITGNGMSLAFEGASLAAGPLYEWSRGQLDWETVCQEIHLRQRSRFGGRLWRARHLQSFLVRPDLQRVRQTLLPLYPMLVPLAFRLTR